MGEGGAGVGTAGKLNLEKNWLMSACAAASAVSLDAPLSTQPSKKTPAAPSELSPPMPRMIEPVRRIG
jgi:hypothetical protein